MYTYLVESFPCHGTDPGTKGAGVLLLWRSEGFGDQSARSGGVGEEICGEPTTLQGIVWSSPYAPPAGHRGEVKRSKAQSWFLV